MMIVIAIFARQSQYLNQNDGGRQISTRTYQTDARTKKNAV